MLLGFLDLRTALIIAHVFGAIIGAGGAFTSDSIFFSTMRDGRISKDEMRFLKLGSRLVWAGLLLLILSGLVMLAMDPARYMSSSKFLAKMSVVGVILGNGMAFHVFHIPRLERNVDKDLSFSKEFVQKSSLLVASGAISMVSWITAVVLGMLRYVPYSYGEIMAVYVCLVLVAVSGAIFLRKRLLGI